MYQKFYLGIMYIFDLNPLIRNRLFELIGLPISPLKITNSVIREYENNLMNIDPEIFKSGFSRKCQRAKLTILLTPYEYLLFFQLLSLTSNILHPSYNDLYIMKYHGNYYIPINEKFKYIGLVSPVTENNLPIPCAFKTLISAQKSIQKYNQMYNTDAELIKL